MSDPGAPRGTPQDIVDWLQGLGLGQYAATFAENEITRDVLLTLDEADLRGLGITAMGHRKKILKAIADEATTARPAPEAEPVEEEPPETKPEPAPFDPHQPAKLFAPLSSAANPPALASRPLPPPTAIARTSAETLHAPPAKAPASAPALPSSSRAPRLSFWAKLAASKFLFISIVAHLLFGMGATYFIVQRIQAKRKVTFQSGPPSTNPSKRALEHKVSMAQKKKTGGAPPQAKRIVSAGIAKISLPDLPTIPTANNVVPGMMAGMGGAGFGTGMGFGSGMGSGMGGGGGGGAGFSFFGFRGSAANVVFVIDISGSMVQGKKDRASYDRLEKEVLTALSALGATTKFNIIAFAGKPHEYASAMVGATIGEKEKAAAWLKSYSPCNVLPEGVDKGNGKLWLSGPGHRHAGTGSQKALERAFEMKPGTIVFVSDGEPTDAQPAGILSDVSEWQKTLGARATINAFAYKADSGDDFMEKLAKQNGGEFKNIR